MFCNEKQCVSHYKSMYFATQTTAFIYILRYNTLNTQRKSTTKYNKSTRMLCLLDRFPRNAESDKQTLYKL